MKRVVWAVLTLAACGVPSLADRIVLRDGRTLRGKIVAETSDKLILQVTDTISTEVARTKVARVVREKDYQFPARLGTRRGPAKAAHADGLVRGQTVCFAQIEGTIENDLMVTALRRSCARARKLGADVVVFEIDTPGGRLDIMQEICAEIESVEPARTVAYLHGGPSGGAYSAGAVLAVACSDIYMAPGTAVGAAAPVVVNNKRVSPVAEKAISAITARIRSLAEKNGHPPAVAAAMVDADIELRQAKVDGRHTFLSIQKAAEAVPEVKPKVELGDWITTKGKLLTLTAREAKKLGFAADLVSSRPQLLTALGLKNGRTADLKTSQALEEAVDRRSRFLVKLDGTIASTSTRARTHDPSRYRYRRLTKPSGTRRTGDFEDEGALWRRRSDACRHAADACLAACRTKLALARKYPEMNIDTKPVQALMKQILEVRERVLAQRNMMGSEL